MFEICMSALISRRQPIRVVEYSCYAGPGPEKLGSTTWRKSPVTAQNNCEGNHVRGADTTMAGIHPAASSKLGGTTPPGSIEPTPNTRTYRGAGCRCRPLVFAPSPGAIHRHPALHLRLSFR